MRRIALAALAAVVVFGLMSCGGWKRSAFHYMDSGYEVVEWLLILDVLTPAQGESAKALISEAERAVELAPETWTEIKERVVYKLKALLVRLYDAGRIDMHDLGWAVAKLHKWLEE